MDFVSPAGQALHEPKSFCSPESYLAVKCTSGFCKSKPEVLVSNISSLERMFRCVLAEIVMLTGSPQPLAMSSRSKSDAGNFISTSKVPRWHIVNGMVCKTLFITHALWRFCKAAHVARKLDAQLAKYLRKARGEMSYAEFSKKVGVSHTTLHRIERGEHRLTLNKLETILEKLKIRLSDVFPEEF